MFKRSSFDLVFNTLFSIVFAVALTGFIQVTQKGGMTFESLLMGGLPAFAFSFVLGAYIPLVKVGSAFAAIFVKNEKSPVFYFLRLFAIVFIMTACMSLLMMFTEIGFKMDLIFAFIFSFPLTFVFAYAVACIVFPFLLKATIALCSKEG